MFWLRYLSLRAWELRKLKFWVNWERLSLSQGKIDLFDLSHKREFSIFWINSQNFIELSPQELQGIASRFLSMLHEDNAFSQEWHQLCWPQTHQFWVHFPGYKWHLSLLEQFFLTQEDSCKACRRTMRECLQLCLCQQS